MGKVGKCAKVHIEVRQVGEQYYPDLPYRYQCTMSQLDLAPALARAQNARSNFLHCLPRRAPSLHDLYADDIEDDVSHISTTPPSPQAACADTSPLSFEHEFDDVFACSPWFDMQPPNDDIRVHTLPSPVPHHDELPPLAALLSASASAFAEEPPSAAPRAGGCKHWCLTLNNFTDDEHAHIASLCDPDAPGHIGYLVLGQEVGETGTPHLQGYVELLTRKRLAWLRENISDRAHWEPRRGTREQAREYCMKDGYWYETGTWHEEERGRRRDIEVMVQQASTGTPFYQACLDQPSTAAFAFAYVKLLEGWALSMTVPWREVEIVVKIGPTGCGKTRSSYDCWPDLFAQDCSAGGEIWWDGYSGQKRLLLDDFEGSLPYPWLLRVLDGYPLRIKVKGAHTYGRWSQVFITSNIDIQAWYPKRSRIGSLLRRISRVERYVGPDEFVVEHFDESD